MKKNKLFILFPLIAMMGLTSCVKYNGKNLNPEPEPSSEDDPGRKEGDPIPGDGSFGEEVTTYLVIGQYGLFNNKPGESIASKFLDYAIEYKAASGSALPTGTEVTSRVSGSRFVSWQSYEGNGATKEYTIVPATSGTILYAKFSGGDGINPDQEEGGGDIPTPPPTETGYGIRYSYLAPIPDAEEQRTEMTVHATHKGKDESGVYEEHVIYDLALYEGDCFQLYDFGNNGSWVNDIDGWSFDGSSASSKIWMNYIEKTANYYRVLHTCVVNLYMKLNQEVGDNIYFGLVSGKIEDLDILEGYGLKINGSENIAGTLMSDPDPVGRKQYKVENKSFIEGDTFQVCDFDHGEGTWAIENVDEYSFKVDGHPLAAPWNYYFSIVDGKYSVIAPFTADIIIKLDNGTYQGDQIYFGLKSSPIELDEPVSGFGIKFADDTIVVGEKQSEQDQGRDQYLIANYEFVKDSEFSLYDFATKVPFMGEVNNYSFKVLGNDYAAPWTSYIDKGPSRYVVKETFTADLYIKLNGDTGLGDEVYFGLKSEPILLDEPNTGFGLRYTVTTASYDYVVAELHDEKDQGRDQYKILNHIFVEGDTFKITDFFTKANWVANIDGASFKNNSASDPGWDSYLLKDNEIGYQVTYGFTADVYIKLNGDTGLGDEIYFSLRSTPAPQSGEPTSGFGIKFNDDTYIEAEPAGQEGGYTQYLLDDQEFSVGQKFNIINFGDSNPSTKRFLAGVDNSSFGTQAPWSRYIRVDTDNNYFEVIYSFQADVYIKLKSGEDMIYFGEPAEEYEIPEENKVTVYFDFGNSYNVSNIDYLKIALNNNWSDSDAVHVSGSLYKKEFYVTKSTSTLNIYFQEKNGGLYGHPHDSNTPIDQQSVNYSAISATTMSAGNSYIVRWTGWATNDSGWSHAWFDYTFSVYNA